MKSSKGSSTDFVASPKWKFFDNCPVCRIMKKAILGGKEISGRQLKKAFSKAEAEDHTV
jgi:hypothetical protein